MKSRSQLPSPRTTAPSEPSPQGLAPPKNPFTVPGKNKTDSIGSAESSPENQSVTPPDATTPPIAVLPANRWLVRRRWLRMRAARFFRTTSPGRLIAIYLGLLALAVLTVIFILNASDSQRDSQPRERSSPTQPTAAEKYESLRRQTAILIRDKKLVEAEANLAVMETLQPKNPDIHSHAGAIATQRKNYDEAKHLYEAVLAEKPGDYVAAYNLAEIAFVTKNFPEAERRFQDLTRSRPYDDNLLFRIFLCEFLQDDVKAAKAISLRLSRTGSAPAWYYANAALARQAKKDQEADEILAQARVLYPSESPFYDATFKSLGLLEPSSSRKDN